MDLPQQLTEVLFVDKLIIGKIIHKFEKSINNPKHKFSIIVGFNEDKSSVARVFINSEINFSIINTDELKQLQLSIYKADYPFLSNPYSYIDCSKIIESAFEDLKQDFLITSDNFFKKNISEELLNEITNKITFAKTIKPYIKQKYRW